MPGLKNPRYEQFAQLVAKGATKTQAAISCGYAESRAASTGSDLGKIRHIVERIAELQGMVAEQGAVQSGLTRAGVLDRLQQLSARAEAEGQFSAAIRAEELRGKELGMFVDRSDQKIKLDKAEDLGPAELERLIAAARAKAEGEEERVQ